MSLRSSVFQRCLVVLATIATAAACGGGDNSPTGPSANFNVAGTWQLLIQNAVGGNATCSVTGTTVTFVNTNSVLSGSLVAAGANSLSCVVSGATQIADFSGTGVLAYSTLQGSDIAFGFRVSSGTDSLSGRVDSDNRMSGTARIRLSFSGVPRTLVGTWVATR